MSYEPPSLDAGDSASGTSNVLGGSGASGTNPDVEIVTSASTGQNPDLAEEGIDTDTDTDHTGSSTPLHQNHTTLADSHDSEAFHDAVEEEHPPAVTSTSIAQEEEAAPAASASLDNDLKSHNANGDSTQEEDTNANSDASGENSNSDNDNDNDHAGTETSESQSQPPTPESTESAVLVSEPEEDDGHPEHSAAVVPLPAAAPTLGQAQTAPSNAPAAPVQAGSPTRTKVTAAAATTQSTTLSYTPWHVKASTPIPNSDSSLRLLRKFISKTSKYFSTAYGGTKGSSILSFFLSSIHGAADPSGGSTLDECSVCYKHLVDILLADVDDESDHAIDANTRTDTVDSNAKDDNNFMIESILGHQGDTMSKARLAIASFCRLMEMWCLDSHISYLQLHAGVLSVPAQRYKDLFSNAKFYNDEDQNNRIDLEVWMNMAQNSPVVGEVLVAALDCAEGLVAHGCFDGVVLEKGRTGADHIATNTTLDDDEVNEFNLTLNDDSFDMEYEIHNNTVSAISVLCESIFKSYLDSEQMELSMLKFLLTTSTHAIKVPGRDGSKGEVDTETMLKGSYLLQAIRICYKMYLSTDSAPNKTTAKAALRQIVTGTFKRLELLDDLQHQQQTKIDDNDGNNNIEVTAGEDPFSHTNEGTASASSKKMNTSLVSHAHSHADDATVKSRLSAAGNFPSFEHKDAYLVLRSLCKLSMKAVTTNAEDVRNLTSSVRITRNHSVEGGKDDVSGKINVGLIPNQSIMMDPALDSKILSLDLILEILQRTKTETLMNAGPHLIYAVRNYLCHSLLKNCTSDNTFVVNLSLQLFVPLIQHFRAHLKTEIEAFVTNVFFVILDSKNSPVEHKLRVVVLFEEICSDPATLAEIFLNYDCDLSAVDLFQRIVNTLARVAKIGLHDQGIESTGLFIGGTGASRAEKTRQNHRMLRLEAMKAVRKILSSLYSSIDANVMMSTMMMKDEPSTTDDESAFSNLSLKRQNAVGKTLMPNQIIAEVKNPLAVDEAAVAAAAGGGEKQTLVQIYDSKKKRKEDLEKVFLKFNQKPKAGLTLASQVGFIDEDDPNDVAQFLLTNKDALDKTQIGEFLGMDADYKDGFTLKVLHNYANAMDFTGLSFDDAIRFYLSGFRLPGEAQKVR